jgi:hypothetical protein
MSQHHNAAAVTMVMCSAITERKLLFFPILAINQETDFDLHFISYGRPFTLQKAAHKQQEHFKILNIF